MTDQELRALVRESIAKQLDGWRDPSGSANSPAPLALHVHTGPHPSHGIYQIAREHDEGAGAPDGNIPCIIEPSVPCTHCNYCKSHGH